MLQPLTIIIPCYNEADRLNSRLFIDYLEKPSQTNFMFVNDGSTDSTLSVLQHLVDSFPEKVKTLSLPTNCGKAEAVRQGILAALKVGAKNVGYWDADLATPLSEIDRFLKKMHDDKAIRIIYGTRVKRLGGKIERHWYRHYFGRILATIISFLLDLPTYDTQCGAKLFNGPLAQELFREPFISSWLFDVEILARSIGILGKDEMITCSYEIPLASWRDVGKSKIKSSYIPKIPYELIKIAHHYRRQLQNK